jgi:hypothetical protein
MANEEMNERLARIETKLDANAASLSILFRGLEGNGQPGIKDRMTGLEAVVRDHLRLHDQDPVKHGNLIQILILVAMVVTCGMMVWAR